MLDSEWKRWSIRFIRQIQVVIEHIWFEKQLATGRKKQWKLHKTKHNYEQGGE